MIEGVANGSCELQIVTVNIKFCAMMYKSHGGTDSISKLPRSKVDMLQVCAVAEDLL